MAAPYGNVKIYRGSKFKALLRLSHQNNHKNPYHIIVKDESILASFGKVTGKTLPVCIECISNENVKLKCPDTADSDISIHNSSKRVRFAAILSYVKDVSSCCEENVNETELLNSSCPNISSDNFTAFICYVTPTFLELYNMIEGQEILIASIILHELNQVIFKTTSKNALIWANQNFASEKFIMSLYQEHFISQLHHPLLLKDFDTRENDLPEICKNIITVSSFPFKNGYLSANTEVIILEGDLDPKSEEETPVNSNTSLLVSHCEDNTNYVNNVVLKVSLINRTLEWNGIISRNLDFRESELFDPFNIIGLPNHVLQKMELTSGSLVIIKKCDKLTQGKKTLSNSDSDKRIVMAVCSSDSLENNVLMPSILHHNLFKHSVPQFDDKVIIEKVIGLEHHDNELTFPEFPHATKVEVSLICSPSHISGYMIPSAQALKQYFSVHRILRVGDTFTIDISDDKYEFISKDDLPGSRPKVLFYVVKKILPDLKNVLAYKAHVSYTTMYQITNTNDYEPSLMNDFYEPVADITYWHYLRPSGLSEYADQLAKCIRPHILQSSKHDVLSPILISGYHGVGKTTIVHAIARRFGLHMLSVKCHHLCGDSAASTEARIRNIISQAKSFVPCILLLQGVSVITKDRDGAGEDPRVSNAFCEMINELSKESLKFPLFTIATVDFVKHLSNDMMDVFLHVIDVQNPEENQRKSMLRTLCSKDNFSSDIDFAYLAQRTAGMVLGDLVALVNLAVRFAHERVHKLCFWGSILSVEEEESLAFAEPIVILNDFTKGLDKMQSSHAEAIGAPKPFG